MGEVFMSDLTSVPGPEQLKQFLYGELSEDETQAIEELLFADSEVFNELTSLENELVDRYVQGKLDGEDLARFERSLSKSGDSREKVRNARALQRYIKTQERMATVPVVGTPPRSPWSHLQALFGFQARALQIGMALIILVLGSGGAWLLFDGYRLRREIAQSRLEQAQRERELEGQRENLKQADSKNLELRKSLENELANQRRQHDNPADKTTPRYIATIVSVGSRGATDATVTPLNVTSVTVQLPLDAETSYDRYRIQRLNNKAISTAWNIRSVKGKKYLAATLPAESLGFSLFGINNKTGAKDLIDTYQLRIRRR
jgi:hypothetical protein